MARPKKEPSEKRDQRFNLRFTLAEIEHLRAQAQAAGMAPHDYARERVLGHRIVPAGDRQMAASLLSELNRVGVNLNQVAKHMNAGRGDLEHMTRATLMQLSEVLAKVARS